MYKKIVLLILMMGMVVGYYAVKQYDHTQIQRLTTTSQDISNIQINTMKLSDEDTQKLQRYFIERLSQEHLMSLRIEYDLQNGVHNRIYYAGATSKYLAQLPLDISDDASISTYSNVKSPSINKLWLLVSTTRYTVASLVNLKAIGIDDFDGDYHISTEEFDHPTEVNLNQIAGDLNRFIGQNVATVEFTAISSDGHQNIIPDGTPLLIIALSLLFGLILNSLLLSKSSLIAKMKLEGYHSVEILWLIYLKPFVIVLTGLVLIFVWLISLFPVSWYTKQALINPLLLYGQYSVITQLLIVGCFYWQINLIPINLAVKHKNHLSQLALGLLAIKILIMIFTISNLPDASMKLVEVVQSVNDRQVMIEKYQDYFKISRIRTKYQEWEAAARESGQLNTLYQRLVPDYEIYHISRGSAEDIVFYYIDESYYRRFIKTEIPNHHQLIFHLGTNNPLLIKLLTNDEMSTLEGINHDLSNINYLREGDTIEDKFHYPLLFIPDKGNEVNLSIHGATFKLRGSIDNQQQWVDQLLKDLGFPSFYRVTSYRDIYEMSYRRLIYDSIPAFFLILMMGSALIIINNQLKQVLLLKYRKQLFIEYLEQNHIRSLMIMGLMVNGVPLLLIGTILIFQPQLLSPMVIIGLGFIELMWMMSVGLKLRNTILGGERHENFHQES